VTHVAKMFATGSDQLALELCVVFDWLKIGWGGPGLHKYMHTTAKRQSCG
jgi:hypothetical protein